MTDKIILMNGGQPDAVGAGAHGLGIFMATAVPALVLCVLVAMEAWQRGRCRRAVLASDPAGLLQPGRSWPGLRGACAAVGLALVFMLCYQLAVPSDGPWGGHRAAALVGSAAAVACACALLVQVHRAWSAGFADIALGLITLAVCMLATLFVPAQPQDLAARYPVLFNAMLFALGLMTWLWNWLADVWMQQREDADDAWKGPGGERGDPAWTTAGRLVPVNRRFSLFTGAAGVGIATLMAVWPALRTVPADDDSLGRMGAGIAGHLLLVLACLRCGRAGHRRVFHVLSLLAIVSMIAFVAIRARPFTG